MFLILFFLIIILYSTIEIRKTRNLLNTIYKHPLTVSNASLRVTVIIKNMFHIMDTLLIIENEILGAFEFFMLNQVEKSHIDFLEEVAIRLSSSLYSSIQNNKISELLENSQNINIELKLQSEKLRITNVALEETTINLEERKNEIEDKNKILNISQRDLEQKALELEKTSQYKSRFLSNMSHELRTPLI